MQFDRAVSKDGAATGPGVTCSMCNRKITDRYWTLGDQPACISCKATVERDAAKSKRMGVYGWSAFYGFGAAMAGAILYYAVLKLLNLEIAIVAIAIGYMVGYSMRKGANGWGGKRYQLTAVALTYFAIAMAYLPLAIEGARDAKKEAKAAADSSVKAQADSLAEVDSTAVVVPDSTAGAVVDSTSLIAPDSAAVSDSAAVVSDSASAASDSAAAPVKASVTDDKSGGFLVAGIALGAAFLFAMALPLLYIVGTLPGGLISALIIFFGMRQAWRMTAGNDLTFHGPLTIPK